MPRMGRLVLANYPHHVVQRGHNRQAVFAADEDYQRYLADLHVRKGASLCGAVQIVSSSLAKLTFSTERRTPLCPGWAVLF